MDNLTEKLVRIVKAHRDTLETGPYLDWVSRVLQEVYSPSWKPQLPDTFSMGQKAKAGLLRDVSEAARLVGFQESVYITPDVWGVINNRAPQSTKTVRERLLETLLYARRACLFGEQNLKVPMLHGRRHFAQFKLGQSDEGWTIELRGPFRLDGGRPLPD